MKSLVTLLLALVTTTTIGQTYTKYVKLTEGHKIWTKSVGSGKVKILFIHGGPGNTHEYFEVFEQRLSHNKYQMIFYDQLGSYHSDKPSDTSLYTINRFVDEIEQVRKGYNFSENLFLIGHSWGGLLAMEYSLKYPDKVSGLIISNKSYSQKRLNETTQMLWDSLALTYPAGSQIINELNNKIKVTDTVTQQIINAKYNSMYRCRIEPNPEPLLRAKEHTNRKVRVLDRDTWDIKERLTLISSPTLIIGANNDFVDEADLKFMNLQIKNSTLYICPAGSHFAFLDDSENYFRSFERFIELTTSKKK